MKRQEESKTEASQAPSDPLITGPSKLLRSPLHVEITTAADKMVPSKPSRGVIFITYKNP